MRRFLALCSFVVLICALTASADEAKGRSFVMHAPHYEVSVTVEPLPSGQVAYEATIKDRTSDAIVAQPRATVAPETDVDLTAERDGVKFDVSVHPHPQSLLAEFEARRDDTVVDKVTSAWNFPTPAEHHLNAPGALHVGGDVKAPLLTHRVNPIYPEAARKDGIAGIVIVEVMIDKTGRVADAAIVKNLPDGLGEAALDAVRQWTFQPATQNGTPVDVIFNLTVNFKP